ncbi:hypothetical protein ACLOJK_026657 [Asimina triloba]
MSKHLISIFDPSDSRSFPPAHLLPSRPRPIFFLVPVPSLLANAFPTTPERPKKVAKVAVSSVRNLPDPGVNDENVAPMAAMDPTPNYVASEDLKPLPDPEAKIKVAVDERPILPSFSLPYFDLARNSGYHASSPQPAAIFGHSSSADGSWKARSTALEQQQPEILPDQSCVPLFSPFTLFIALSGVLMKVVS